MHPFCQAFTLNSVPPANDEIVAGAIARNFVSRDLLEAKNLEDAMHVRRWLASSLALRLRRRNFASSLARFFFFGSNKSHLPCIDHMAQRVCSPAVSVGHSYNLTDVRGRRIVNVETASGNRFAVREAGAVPFFHANMYRHLQVKQVRGRDRTEAMHRVDSTVRWLTRVNELALRRQGAGRELDEQGEESCAVFVSSGCGLQRGGALAAGRHS